jgi:hypothetical protein
LPKGRKGNAVSYGSHDIRQVPRASWRQNLWTAAGFSEGPMQGWWKETGVVKTVMTTWANVKKQLLLSPRFPISLQSFWFLNSMGNQITRECRNVM